MKKRTIVIFLSFVFLAAKSREQTVVVTDNSAYVTGQASSVLDVYSVSKGFLAPRMTTAQRIAISAPTEGLLVYQIDGTKGFYYYTNSAWSSLSATGSSWSLTGNSGTSYPTNFLGTTDLKSLRFQTNSVQGLMLDSLGNVGIGSTPGFTAGTFQEKFLVNAGTTSSYNAIIGRGTINNYLQLNIQNLSNGVNASSDVVATADNGTEIVNYVDLGINSSTNTQNVMGAANDAYLYTTGNNFLIGTGTAGKALVFMTGGTTQSANERMRIDGTTGFVGIGTTAPGTALHVVGTNPLTLFGVQTGAITDSILTITSGTVRKLAPSALAASTSWSLTGNAGTSYATNYLGTTDLKSLRFRTNATQGLILDSLGNVGIGSAPGFTTGTFEEKLLIDAGTTSSYNAIVARGSLNNYFQLNIQNKSNGNTASSDVVATADNGTEIVNYVNMGINSSTNTQNVMGAADDAYLYTTGNNLLIGTATAAKALVFMTGGTTQSTNERMRIDGTTGFVGIGTTAPATALHVVGTNPLTLVGIQSAAATDSILTINGSGTVRKMTITNLLGGGSSMTAGSIPFIGGAGTLAQNNASLFWDSTDSRLGVGTNTPASDLTMFQSAGGAGPARGFRFTGNSIGGTNTGTGFSMALGYNATGNKQLWLGDADYLNNSAGTFIRYSSITGATGIDAVNGTNTSRRALSLAIGSDPNSGVILGNDGNSASPSSFVWANGNMSVGSGYRSNAAPVNGLLVQGNMGIGTVSPATALHVVGTNPLTLNGVQTGATSDSILTIASGTVRKLPFTTLTSGASWSLTGNAGTSYPTNFLGTTDLKSLRFQTNSVQGMFLDSLGNVGIGAAPGFTTGTFEEKLLIDAGTTGSYNAIVARGTLNNYFQLNIQNKSNGNTASSDVVATADNGTEAVNYVDLGINGSGYTQNVFGAADDAYLYTTGNNLLIGTATAAKALVFMTGGTTQSTNERMRIDGTTGFVGIGTTAPATALHVTGTNPLTLFGVQTGAVTDSILTITAGTVRKLAPSALAASTSWSLTGNAGTSYATNYLGTTDLKSLRFRTDATQGLILDSLGNVGVGAAPGFTTGTFQEKFLVDAGTTTSYNAIIGRGSINNYLQLNIQNLSNGVNASSDVVATADNGTEIVNYVDLGINSSTNTSGSMGAADDAYLYTTGNNFLFGTATAAKALVFMTGGTTQSTNERMRIDGTGNVGIDKTTPAFKVDVHGRGNFDSTLNAPAYTSTFQTLTFGTTTTWDQTKGATAAVTLTANATLSITNEVAGMYGLIRITQDATGSRTLTLPAGSKVINGGGGIVTLTTTAGATDVLSYFYDGVNYYWTVGYNYN
jgi:hypothetical protein